MERVDGRTKDPTGLGFHGTSRGTLSPLSAIKKRPEKDKKMAYLFLSMPTAHCVVRNWIG